MIVDHQCHWFTETRFEQLLDLVPGRFPRAERGGDVYRYFFDAESAELPWLNRPYYYDLDLQLADMDSHGIDVALMAPCLFGEVSGLELGEAKEILTFVNAESARAVAELPERRRALAMLPMQDTAAAIEMLDDAIGRLGLSGVSMISHVDDGPLVNEQRMPIFERIADLGVPIFLHPSSRSIVYDNMTSMSRAAEVGLAWMFETSAAALSFAYSGALDRCPNLTVVHPHLGGVLPYLRARFEMVHNLHLSGERTLNEYLREHFYVDTVNDTPGAVEMAAAMYGPDRIVYATDYPWVDRDRADAQFALLAPDLARQIRSNRVPGLDLPGK
jgi:aminocarboxymuconate-semialdehyde decarboxylase